MQLNRRNCRQKFSFDMKKVFFEFKSEKKTFRARKSRDFIGKREV
jgi:hypothetical protein